MGILDSVVGGAKQKAQPVKEDTHTKVKDKFFGGREVEKTTVRRKGRKRQVETTEVHTGAGGRHKKTEHRVSGDKI